MEHSKAQKLLELRAKTDRQLVALISRLLDRGRSGDAERLLPVLTSPMERRRLEIRIGRSKELPTCKSVYAA